MNITVHSILVVIALLLAIASLIRPAWPLLSVAVLILCVDLLIAGR